MRIGTMEQFVLVTGASRGIGRAVVLYLDRLGFRVFAGVRSGADAEALRREASPRLVPVLLDVTDPELISGAVSRLTEETGDAGLYGLVNNAGIAVAAPLEFLPIEELRRQLEVNVVGQIAVTRALLPMLRKARGRIVNMSSSGGLVAGPLLGAYHASKFALEALTDSLRGELLPWGIRVCAVEPGEIATPIWETSRKAADALLQRLPADLVALYGERVERMKGRAERAARTGLPPETVARAVARALTAKRPRPRYPVGPDAWVASVIRFLPAGLRDAILELRR